MPDLPFSTDGCSGPRCLWQLLDRVLLGTLGSQPPFEWACKLHDVAYYFGGTKADKAEADRQLRTHVAEVLEGQWLAKPLSWSIWLAVTLAGGPRRRTSYRWAYGWLYERDRCYRALSQELLVERAELILQVARA